MKYLLILFVLCVSWLVACVSGWLFKKPNHIIPRKPEQKRSRRVGGRCKGRQRV